MPEPLRCHVLGPPDGLQLEVTEYGAAVHRLWVPCAGGRRNVALGHATLPEYVASTAFFGATIGRYANRIGGGEFVLDSTRLRLDRNERGNTLHGGGGGFDTRTWTTDVVSDRLVAMSLVSPDGDQGFPGELRATVSYAVDADTVTIELSAVTSQPTVVSLTNHTYFNLDGEGAGSVDDHLLSVSADGYTPTDTGQIPTGEIAPVAGTPFDLRAPTRIGDVVREDHPQLRTGRGIDHNLVLRGSGLRKVASLSSPDSGISLTLATDAPGLQVYTGNSLDGSTAGTSGRVYRQGDGIALEPQAFPDAPNRPEFGSVVLRPGEAYHRTIRWRFGAQAR